MSPSAPDVTALRDDLTRNGYGQLAACWPQHSLHRLRQEATALVARFDAGDRRPDFWCYDRDGSDVLYRIHNLEKQPESVHAGELFLGGLLHDTASGLLGDAKATVAAMIVKTPGVAGVPWHRDRTDLPPGRGVNLSIFLEDATPENGCLVVVPGSHRAPDDAHVDQLRAAGPQVPVAIKAGDLVVHDVRLVHASGDNTATAARRSVIVEFLTAPPS